MPRGPHGVLLADATNPEYNPMNRDATGHFEAEPIVDFAEHAKEKAIEQRKAAVGKDGDDWPLLWIIRLVKHGADDTE